MSFLTFCYILLVSEGMMSNWIFYPTALIILEGC